MPMFQLQAKKRAAASKQAVASKVIKIMKPVIDNMKTEKAQWGDDDDVILIVRLNAVSKLKYSQ